MKCGLKRIFLSLVQIQSNSRVIEIGHTAILQCKASGNPTPKVHWLKDMKRVELSQRYTLLDGACNARRTFTLVSN